MLQVYEDKLNEVLKKKNFLEMLTSEIRIDCVFKQCMIANVVPRRQEQPILVLKNHAFEHCYREVGRFLRG